MIQTLSSFLQMSKLEFSCISNSTIQINRSFMSITPYIFALHYEQSFVLFHLNRFRLKCKANVWIICYNFGLEISWIFTRVCVFFVYGLFDFPLSIIIIIFTNLSVLLFVIPFSFDISRHVKIKRKRPPSSLLLAPGDLASLQCWFKLIFRDIFFFFLRKFVCKSWIWNNISLSSGPKFYQLDLIYFSLSE